MKPLITRDRCGYIIAAIQAIRDRVAKDLEEAEREAGKSV